MDLENYKEDQTKQNGGTPIYIEDATFFGKRIGTPECDKKIKEITLRIFGPFHKWAVGDINIIHAHLLVEYLITGWEGLFFEGKELIYSRQLAREIFLDFEYHLSLNKLLIENLSNFENFLHDAKEEDIEEVNKKIAWDFEEMESAAELFTDEELDTLRPKLTEIQSQLVSAFYTARREVAGDVCIPREVIEKFASPLFYELDLAVAVIQRADNTYLDLRAKKLKSKKT